MRQDIGETRAESSRGIGKERSIKQKPRQKFPVRKRGTKAPTRIRQTTVIVI